VLFRRALSRHNLQQRALLAYAMEALVKKEEAGSGVQALALQGNALGSLGAAHLAFLVRKSSTLRCLSLGCNPIGDEGATLLGRALHSSASLETLALQDCRITSRGIRHLASGLGRNRSLTSLWLFGNASDDEGASHLAAALLRCPLLNLGLEMNRVKATGAEALALMLTKPGCALSWLRLQHNPIGDEGARALARALHINRTLTKLQLRETGTGSQACAEIARALPKNRSAPAAFPQFTSTPLIRSWATDPLVCLPALLAARY
jgi:Ran GTPase-activating protein (RanGAP) involved in mRNA processing and transport